MTTALVATGSAALADTPLPVGRFMHILGDNSIILPKCHAAWEGDKRRTDRYECEFVQLWLTKMALSTAPQPPPGVVEQVCDPAQGALDGLRGMVDKALSDARAKHVETHYPATFRLRSKRWRPLLPLLTSVQAACRDKQHEKARALLAKAYALLSATRECRLRLHSWKDTFFRDSPRSWANKPQALGPCKCTRVSTFTLERFEALHGKPMDDWIYRSKTSCTGTDAACKDGRGTRTLEASWWYGVDVALEDLGCQTLRIGSAPHS